MIGRDLDFDLHNAIQELIADGLLEENAQAHSVARLVIHDGYDSLTPADYREYLLSNIGSQGCLKCGNELISWNGPRDYIEFRLEKE